VVVSSAVTIKDDAAAKLPPPTQSISANPASRPAAVVNDSLRGTPQAGRARMLEAYGNLPLSFEINEGQTDPRVEFLSRGGYSLFLTANEVLLTLRKGSPPPKFGSEQASHRLPIGWSRPAGFIAAHAEQRSP
jgi:hypothetical protein